MQIIQFVIGFIVIAIVMNLGMYILAGTTADCSNSPDWVVDTADADQVGWAQTCLSQNTSIQSAWVLLNVIYIVLVAVIILNTLGMLNVGGSGGR